MPRYAQRPSDPGCKRDVLLRRTPGAPREFAFASLPDWPAWQPRHTGLRRGKRAFVAPEAGRTYRDGRGLPVVAENQFYARVRLPRPEARPASDSIEPEIDGIITLEQQRTEIIVDNDPTTSGSNGGETVVTKIDNDGDHKD